MKLFVGNNGYEEEDAEELKEKWGIDEALVHDAIQKDIPMNLPEVKKEIDRAIIEKVAKFRAKYGPTS